MKKIFIIATIVLFTGKVFAQLGAPKELTCTEEAFNFSVSLGSKLKLGIPKMGPAEILRDDPDYMGAWSLRLNHTPPKTPSLPLSEMELGAGNAVYAHIQQNYVPAASPYGLKIIDRLKNLFSPQFTAGMQPPPFYLNPVSNKRTL